MWSALFKWFREHALWDAAKEATKWLWAAGGSTVTLAAQAALGFFRGNQDLTALLITGAVAILLGLIAWHIHRSKSPVSLRASLSLATKTPADAPRLDVSQENDPLGGESLKLSADKDLTVDSIGPLLSQKTQLISARSKMGLIQGGSFKRYRISANDITGTMTSLKQLVGPPENHTIHSVTLYYTAGEHQFEREFSLSQHGDSIDWVPMGPPRLHDPRQQW